MPAELAALLDDGGREDELGVTTCDELCITPCDELDAATDSAAELSLEAVINEELLTVSLVPVQAHSAAAARLSVQCRKCIGAPIHYYQ